MAQLTLFVPNLFAQLFARPDAEVDPSRWPCLALLLARAHARRLDSSSIEENLTMAFGRELDHAVSMSIAEVTAAVDYDAGAVPGVLRADPVHLRADPNQVLLFNDPGIMPSAQEADSLIEELNAGLPDLGLSRGRHPARWYFQSDETAATTMTSPSAVSGRSIANYLPRGAGATEFAQLINEAQMILHGAAVNIAREARGIVPINSIWPWGGAPVGQGADYPLPDLVIGDDVLTAGLARCTGLNWCAELEPGQLLVRLQRQQGRTLAVIGSPTGSVDAGEPMSDIDVFEERWCRVLLNSLRRLRLKQLVLITDRHRYSLTPWSLFKLWRKPRSIGTDMG